MSSNEALVLIERRGDVAVVRLNRPEARNAMNAALAQATVEAMDSCQDAGAIVLTGTDPAFCAGLDLRDLGVPKLSDLPRFTGAALGSGVPVIAAVNGPAVDRRVRAGAGLRPDGRLRAGPLRRHPPARRRSTRGRCSSTCPAGSARPGPGRCR